MRIPFLSKHRLRFSGSGQCFPLGTMSLKGVGLISVVNQLQDVFSTLDCESPIKLPQIVVVGTQSAGKSSVLESLVGRDFLPRGTGTVTRRPLVLQLIQIKKDHPDYKKNGGKEWATFLEDCNLPASSYTDFEKVREHIIKVTDLVAGAKVAAPGQPENVEELVSNMIRPYIHDPKSIILAVTPANTDIATSDAIKFAREADPHGDRTLAVITMLDAMVPGADARDVLTGAVIPVKLGIIGVINRSPKAVAEKKLLMQHIRTYLPAVKEQVNQQIADHTRKLEAMGEALPEAAKLLGFSQNLLLEFTDAYHRTVWGLGEDDTDVDLDDPDPRGGSKISEIFVAKFDRILQEVEPLGGLKRQQIAQALGRAPGLNPPVFLPEQAFLKLVKKQIGRLKRPCSTCVKDVHEEMLKVVQQCGKTVGVRSVRRLVDQSRGSALRVVKLLRFPKLQARVNTVMRGVLEKRNALAVDLVGMLLEMHTTFVNTKHPDIADLAKQLMEAKDESEGKTTVAAFVVPSKGLVDAGAQEDADFQKSVSPRIYKECLLLEKLIREYFFIVRKNIQDAVPKAVVCTLIKSIQSEVRNELYEQIYRQKDSASLLYEPEELTTQREELTDMLAALEKASDIISTVSAESVQ